ncbi:tyrosine-type recombinase/integrase [Arthrobacter glacialis]|uniref:Integrase n=1 Tax=Arthrobacter glacialis TaxID=1664 RepID=A0A2S4A1J2_ARTGL|nr:integrase [Arthrobacter glacialis]
MTTITSAARLTLDLSETLQDWRRWQNAQGLSERTIKERAGILTALVQRSGISPKELDSKRIISFLSRTDITTVTKSTYFVALKAYFTWLIRSEQRIDDPTQKVPSPKRKLATPRPISTEQLSRTLGSTKRMNTRMQILLAAFAGLRVHEIAKFRGEDVDRYSATLTVTGKGSRTHQLPIAPELMLAMENWPQFGYWFPSPIYKNEPVQPYAISISIKRAMERAGVHATPHQLRHWYATTLLDQGTDIRIVQELMRHQTLATTQIYTLVSDKQRRTAINRLEFPKIEHS